MRQLNMEQWEHGKRTLPGELEQSNAGAISARGA